MNPTFEITMENGGVIEGELYPDKAPQSVRNFIDLCDHHFYDGLIFHRVIPGFMIQSTDCFVCNQQEAGILFSDDYSGKTPEEMIPIISAKVQAARIPAMIVTMGADGAVYANLHGESGY